MTSAPHILAQFITPTLFWGGAAAVSVPILIHLLARRRFKRIRWAAMDFLIDAERRNRRRVRMEEWILLALRCLAILLLALIVSRPFLRPGGLASALGGSRQTERIFVIDDSFSMAYAGENGQSFDRGKKAVRRLIDLIRRDHPDDTVTIIRMSDPAGPIEAGTYLDQTQVEDVYERIEGLAPTDRSVDVSNVIGEVADYLDRSEGIVSAAVYFVTDLQQVDWAMASSTGEETDGILSPLGEWSNDDRALRVIFVNIGDEEATNTAVTDLQVTTGQLVAGTTGTIKTGIANFSETSASNVDVDVFVGPLPQGTKTLPELPAGRETFTEVEAEFVQAGDQSVRVEIAPDRLPVDDKRYLATEVSNAIQVLIVNGEPALEALTDEVALFATALRPEGEVFSGIDRTIVDEVELEEINLASFHAVVLANVYRLSDPTVESLERYVRNGGGVLIYLGDQVDADLTNASLYRDGEGILPARLTESVVPAEPVFLQIDDPLHPTVRGLARDGDPLGIGQIPFTGFVRAAIEEPVDEKVAVEVEEEPDDAQALREATVIARFADTERSPAMIEKPFGAGRALLITSSADKEWNRWPDHPTYVPFVNELVKHIARRAGGGDRHRVGDTIELPIDPAVHEKDALVRTPAYPEESESAITAGPASSGAGLALRWEKTDRPGIYEFLLRLREGGEQTKLVAVNPDPRESDLTMCAREELSKSAAGVPFEYISDLDQLGDDGEGRTELWRFFLFAAVVTLMTEQGLAWHWGNRR